MIIVPKTEYFPRCKACLFSMRAVTRFDQASAATHKYGMTNTFLFLSSFSARQIEPGTFELRRSQQAALISSYPQVPTDLNFNPEKTILKKKKMVVYKRST